LFLTCIEDHEEEVFVVFKPDAIVDPLAMMVHFEPARAALTAMMRSWWLRENIPIS
jgi:hypothetical protein